MKILFLQTAHLACDDRVHYHQRVCLEHAGHTCAFAASTAEVGTTPDLIICDTPKAIWDARKAFGRKVTILYDITEWYPSKKNLRNLSIFLKPLKFCVLVLANLWAGAATNAFLFGEYYKARPFRFLFPWKRYIYLPYYPSLAYIPALPSRTLNNEVRLFYSGPQTAEKGYNRVQQVVEKCQTLLPDKRVVLTAIHDVSFEMFCQEITKHDFFLDLRDDDIENTRCLPIKLFYYLAAGRPVIYSDLKAIRKGVPEIIGDSLVRPDAIDQSAEKIAELVHHPELYLAVCQRNKDLAETHYNWETQQKQFIAFIESCLSSTLS